MANNIIDSLIVDWYVNGCIAFGSFKLKDPKLPPSPVYMNFRLLRSLPDILSNTVKVLQESIIGLNIKTDLIADVPTAATPLVTALTLKSKIPMITPRHEQKTTGSLSTIDGIFRTGQKVLIIDDVITTAASKIESAKVLKDAGLDITGIMVLVDRMQGGREEVEKLGLKFYAITDILTVVKTLHTKKLIDDKIRLSVEQYIKENKKS